MEKQGGVKRVVLVPYPDHGHKTPLLQLGALLHSRAGFSITIAHAKYQSPDPSDYPSFDYLPLPDGISQLGIPSWNALAIISALNSNCKDALEEYLLLHNNSNHDKVACVVIYDSLMNFAESVATRLKLPSFAFRISGILDLLSYCTIPRLIADGFFPLKDSTLEEPVPNLTPLRFKDLPLTHCEPWALKLQATLTKIGNSCGIIFNTVHFLEHSFLSDLEQHYAVPFFTVGPLHKTAPDLTVSFLEEDTGCLAWLDKRKAPRSVLYVSFGSLAVMDKDELAEMAWGLFNSGQPFLWVVRPGSVSGSEWIELLPEGFKERVGERGRIVKWAQQKQVLAHSAVGGFWSHCGWNSLMESLSQGVPMICRPRSGDQKVNARCVTELWRVGVPLEQKLERGEVERAIRRLMADDEAEEIRGRASRTKEKINASVNTGGCSQNSLNQLVELIQSFV